MAALPHHSEFIEKYDRGTCHYLLEELKRALLSELRNMLEGADIERDRASLDQMSIMNAVNQVVKDSESKLVGVAGLQK